MTDFEAVVSEPLVVATTEQRGYEELVAPSMDAVADAIALPTHAPLPTASAEEILPASQTANGRRLRKRSSAPLEPDLSPPPIAPPTIKTKTPELVDRSAIAALDDVALNA